MNFQKLLHCHIQNKTDITVAVTPVEEKKAPSFGLVKLRDNMQISNFIEKPKTPELLTDFNCSSVIKEKFPKITETKPYLASMGIYLFNKEALFEALDNDLDDFGNDIIPMAIQNKKVCGYLFHGFWEDVGTIRSFWETHIGFTKQQPNFDFYKASIITHSRHLHAARVYGSNINETLLCEGSIIHNAQISSSIIGIRSIIQRGVRIKSSILMGADYYEDSDARQKNKLYNRQNIEIGEGTIIENAIIDKNARIGKNCRIVNHAKLGNFNGKDFFIRDGIIIIPKDAEIPDKTEI